MLSSRFADCCGADCRASSQVRSVVSLMDRPFELKTLNYDELSADSTDGVLSVTSVILDSASSADISGQSLNSVRCLH